MNSPINWKKALIPAVITTGMMIASTIQAAPALEEPQQITQPSGETFTAIPKGDEWNNRVETSKGFTVNRGPDGVWRYVTGFGPDHSPALSDTPADRPAPPGLNKHLRSSASRPSQAPAQGTSEGTGDSGPSAAPVQTNSSVLFILTEFNDRAGSTTEADWEGFVSNNVRDFYLQTSHGNAQLNPANESFGSVNNGVVGWVNVGYNHPNTRGNTNITNRELSEDAVIAADPYINYADYDTNNDGVVTGNELSIVVIVAGYETAYGGTSGALSPSVWGHKWSLPFPYPVVDGISLRTYAQFGELHATSTSNEHQASMGIMVHELGHLTYGLPDLYDTDGSSNGIGAFGVMASGSWGLSYTNGDNYSGETPVNASAWTKYHMNWVEGFEGNGTESIVASGSGTDSDTVFRASTGISNEYFLVENRQPAGYDYGLERWLNTNFSGGLAIWHIDDSLSSNANDSHRLVDLEEANGSSTASTNAALWTATNGTLFDDASNPNSKLYNGSGSGVTLSNISASASTMTVNFGSPTPTIPTAPTNLSANAISHTEINLIWNDNSSNEDGFKVDRSLDGSNWTTIASSVPANSQSYNDTGLSPTTPYYYRVLAFNAAGDSSYTNTANATTQQEPTPPPATPTGLTATDGANGTALLNWNDVDGETGYEIQREQAHKKRANTWVNTTLVGTTAADTTSFTDPSGANTFRYRVRAFNNSGASNWSAWDEVTVTGGGGGGGGDKPCRGKKCNP